MVDFKFIGWSVCYKLQFKLVRTAKTISMETRVLAHFSACAFPYIAVLGKVNLVIIYL